MLNKDESWVDKAICVDEDPELFYSSYPENIKKAQSICEQCPVRFACLQAALNEKERWGVRGGNSPNELRKNQAIDHKGDYKVSTNGPIKCGFCGPRSTKNLEVVDRKRTRTTLRCTVCGLKWVTRKVINRNLSNF